MQFRIRFENEKGTVVTIEQDKEGFLVSRSTLTQDMFALAHTDPLIQRFERWARGLLAEGFSLDRAAHALATSKRTLARRMQSVLGKSPLAFFQDLRIERAVHLLRTSRASVDQIAAEVGYAEGSTLRALLRRRVGRGVREIRRSL
jgi:transcriptional regulator GlxA family with amidase domain